MVILSGDRVHIITRHRLHVHHRLCVRPLQETLDRGRETGIAVIGIVVPLGLGLFYNADQKRLFIANSGI